MSGCNEQPLAAYHDGELDASAVARVQEHLRNCPGCAREVQELRRASRLLRDHPFPQLSEREMEGLHDAVAAVARQDADEDQQVWRLGGTLGLVAASVLVVGSAWLNALPAQPAGNRQATVASVPANVRPATPPGEWERMAMTLRPGPIDFSIGAPGLDRTQLADATEVQLADWMLNGLEPGARR